ncbi:MAG: lecithin retinol acyltransferase family protein [Spiroplasmataceae bacterium]|nr:lecithin retinol acyltransferase family protein [Spiroplasmataceae bacterium]
MTKKSLQDWCNNNSISHSEKEKLNKIGIGNYDYHYLIDLQQILRCANWAQNSSEIRNKLSGRIKKIVFFTPNFNDSKPDASNYSCAIVTDGSDNNWVVSYRPSYLERVGSDIFFSKSSNLYLETKLNSEYPVTAMENTNENFLANELIIKWPYVYEKDLSSDVKYNPDKYLLPFDVVKRPTSLRKDHYAIYLGDEWVAHLTGKDSSSSGEGGTKFDTWNKFCNPDSSSSSFSNSSGSNGGMVTLYHPQIPFKRKNEIIRHVSKVISYNYGSHSYDLFSNNCEHLAKSCVFGLEQSPQAALWEISSPLNVLSGVRRSTNTMKDLTNKLKDSSSKLDNLTSNYFYEKGRIEEYIQSSERSRSYTRSKYQIEQEKFQERIEVNPEDWCRIS